MKTITSGFIYCVVALCVGIVVMVSPIMLQAYKELGIQLPGLTETFYNNALVIEIIMLILSISAVALSFSGSVPRQSAAVVLTNIVVFIFSLFVTASAVPFIPLQESLGNGSPRPVTLSVLLPCLSVIFMIPFHVLTLWKLRFRV